MSTVTQGAPVLGQALLTEVLAGLWQASAGRLEPEAATALAERLSAAMVGKAARQAHGKGGPTGPTGVRAWYKVVDSEADDAWTRDLGPLSDWLGLTKGSLQTYLNRGQGAYHTMVQRDGRDIMVSVKYASATEKARLDAAEPSAIPMWQPPAPKKRDPKKLA